MIIKHYKLQAHEPEALALRTALNDLAAIVADLPGVIRVDIYQDVLIPHQLLMVEQWESEPAYQASSGLLDKNAFKPVMALLSAPPELDTLVAFSTNGEVLPS